MKNKSIIFAGLLLWPDWSSIFSETPHCHKLKKWSLLESKKTQAYFEVGSVGNILNLWKKNVILLIQVLLLLQKSEIKYQKIKKYNI